jgi:hypothetical protein
MARDLPVIVLGMDFAHTRSARQAANAIAAQNARYAGVGDRDAVTTRKLPGDPNRPDMIIATQVKDLVDDLGRPLIGRLLRNRLGIKQRGFPKAEA